MEGRLKVVTINGIACLTTAAVDMCGLSFRSQRTATSRGPALDVAEVSIGT